MAGKTDVQCRLPIRRGLGEVEAAMYLSLSTTFFRRLVDEGVMPRPRLAGRRRIWDVEELDAAFKTLPREEGGDPDDVEQLNTWADYE